MHALGYKHPRKLLLILWVQVYIAMAYIYSIDRSIRNKIAKFYKISHTKELKLDISIDGIPISKSSTIGFWTILCLIRNWKPKQAPFLIEIFYGEGKPTSCNDFSGKFVEEFKSLSKNVYSCQIQAAYPISKLKAHSLLLMRQMLNVRNVY